MTNELGTTQPDDGAADNPEREKKLERQIKARAYRIWMDEGQPEGKDREHWVRAKAEVLASQPGR